MQCDGCCNMHAHSQRRLQRRMTHACRVRNGFIKAVILELLTKQDRLEFTKWTRMKGHSRHTWMEWWMHKMSRTYRQFSTYRAEQLRGRDERWGSEGPGHEGSCGQTTLWNMDVTLYYSVLLECVQLKSKTFRLALERSVSQWEWRTDLAVVWWRQRHQLKDPGFGWETVAQAAWKYRHIMHCWDECSRVLILLCVVLERCPPFSGNL